MTVTEKMMLRWGTWEELVLGGAVLRHGTRAWDVVASELRARTLHPCGSTFTAEVCKAKYEDLQERFCGCTAWFEELRKQRVAELKRELEKSVDSIGSLESKLESLKTDNGEDCRVDYDPNRTESPVTVGNLSEGAEFSGKEISKDGLSAGSFTEETPANWSSECQNPATVFTQETDTKTEQPSDDMERDKIACAQNPAGVIGGGRGGSVRKRRGKRKRKDCSKDVKEGSVGENDVISSANVTAVVPDKEESTGVCDRSVKSAEDDLNDCNRGEEDVDLMRILDSVMENDCASVFRRRLDSQRRSRYKRIVRRHLDFDTIRSRIVNRLITSTRELFRDVLLLANNAVIFYPKNTRQYKSALSLRDLAKKTFRQIDRDSSRESGIAAAAPVVAEPPTRNPPVKPRSMRPYNRKVNGKVADAGKVVTGTPPRNDKKERDVDSPVELTVVGKKGFGRPGKLGLGGAKNRTESSGSGKGRKRARRG